MGKRIRLGQLSGSTYGLKVSKEGQDVDSATGKNLLFDSTNAGKSPIYFGKTVNVGNNTVNNNIGSRSDFDTSIGYITHSGTKLQYNPLVVVIEDVELVAFVFSIVTSNRGHLNIGYVSQIRIGNSSKCMQP